VSFFGNVLDALRRWLRPRPTPTPGPGPSPQPGGALADLFARHNAARAAAGLPPLAHNAALTAAAQNHADWMAARGTLSHDEAGAPFTARLAAAGYRWGAAGENIAEGRTSAADTFGDWMASPGHRANVLNPAYRDCGLGVAYSRGGVPYWCVDFGAPGAFDATVNPGWAVSLPGRLPPR
jgi:uncharacterized protein YkwD